MTIREQTERLEHQMLSPHAAFADQARPREREEALCPIRTCFQRDRDRILHCNAYRRLMHKTQVFLSPEGDHYRTRLTHTLEVSQIARTIARALRLNEDLTEAIALGHDLGHTPFGHAGERALDAVCAHGFVHAGQSVRVVRRLERGGAGLNLCPEVLDGIACHTGGQAAFTLEGQVVRFADKIAYMNHDIEDAIRAGVLSPGDIPWDVQYRLGRSKGERITAFITGIIAASGEGVVAMEPEALACFHKLRSFLFESVYTNPKAKGEEGKAEVIVKQLYEYYLTHPERMPQEYVAIAQTEDTARAVADYISGMSDRYCITVFEDLFVPRSWGL